MKKFALLMFLSSLKIFYKLKNILMKKLFAIVLILALSNVLWAQKTTYTYHFDEAEMIMENGFTDITIKNCYNFGDEGTPSIPYFGTNILLPQNHEIKSINIVSADYSESVFDIVLKPEGRQVPLSQKDDKYQAPVPNEKIYTSSEKYPKNEIENMRTHFLSGHGIASFLISAVQYFPAQKEVKFLKKIIIEIETQPTKRTVSAANFLKKSIATNNRISKIVDNPEKLDDYDYSTIKTNNLVDILLITNNELLPAFAEYISFKESTGFIVETITTEDIYSTYTGQDEQEKIRNCVIDFYTNKSLSYVILGGDGDSNYPADNIIPQRGFYTNAYGTDETNIPADMYYACLDGTWNDDGDGKWGEDGEDDLYAEIGIGRICVDDATEIANFTHKLIMYQNNPVIEDIEKTLMIGELLWNEPTWGGTYKNEVAEGSSNHGYTTVGVSDNFSIEKLYEMEYNWSISDVFNQFNNVGINLRNHLGHSDVNYNMKMYNSSLTTDNFTNDGITRGFVIGYSQGCYNGSFDNRGVGGGYNSEDCFSERITTMETADVACIGNSRYGWGQHSSTDGASQYFDRQFFDAIFGENLTTIGDANSDSKEDNVSFINSHDGAMRWCTYEINLFGDPTMDIWTAIPDDFVATYPASIPIGSIEVAFQTGVPNARIALSRNEILIGRAVADDLGNATLEFFEPVINPEVIDVSIIGHNKNRHMGEIIVVSDQPFVIFNEYSLTEITGNGNNIPDYNEEFGISLLVKNVGDQPAFNVEATITLDDPYATISNNVHTIGTIEAGSIATLSSDIELIIADNVPDQHILFFELEINGDEKNVWNSHFSLYVNAPQMGLEFNLVNDEFGNNNNKLDPGETVMLNLNALNNGNAVSPEAICTISSTSEYVTINTPEINAGAIETSNPAEFCITIANETPLSTNIDFDFTIVAGEYSGELSITKKAGLVIEDWESGDFTNYEWEFAGTTDWNITDSEVFEGVYSAQSGTISHNQFSEITVSVDVTEADVISFYKKVSSEVGWDFFEFYIDNNLQDSWSGEENWSLEEYDVTAGTHNFSWKYDKDGSENLGSDCAWIDNISLPGAGNNVVAPEFISEPPSETFLGQLYNYNITAVDENTSANLQIAAPLIPDWLELTDNTDGTALLSGTSLAPGLYNVILTVTNGEATSSQIFTIECLSNVPYIVSQPVTEATEDIEYIYEINTQAVNIGDQLTIECTQQPDWLSFTDNGDGTALMTGLPENGNVGTHDITIKVKDNNNLESEQIFAIEVINVNDAPEFTTLPILGIDAVTEYIYDIEVIDDDNDELTIECTTKPEWLTYAITGNNNASLIGTPTESNIGENNIVITVSDGIANPVEQTFTLNVFPVGISTAQNTQPEIYPNPVKDILYFRDVEHANIYIYNVLGKQVYSQKNVNTTHQIILSDFAEGTYFVKIINKQKIISKKINVIK
jgi:hypothetical protein